MSDEFTWSSKTTQSIPVGKTSWTTLEWGDLRTEWTWHDGLRIWVHAQLAIVQPDDRALWATWVDFQVVQKRPGQPLDPTALDTVPIVKLRQGKLFSAEMDTVEGETYSLRCQHDGAAPVKLTKRILKVGTNLTRVTAS